MRSDQINVLRTPYVLININVDVHIHNKTHTNGTTTGEKLYTKLSLVTIIMGKKQNKIKGNK